MFNALDTHFTFVRANMTSRFDGDIHIEGGYKITEAVPVTGPTLTAKAFT